MHPSGVSSWESRKSPSGWPGCGVEDRSLNLLCLDGGGVKGLSSLYVLQKILAAKTGTNKDVRPWEYFHMIGGTSTGGLIAIMLGRLGMSIEECINAYVRLAETIFGKKKHWSPYNFFFHEQERYDSAILEAAIQEVLIERGFDTDELMKESGSDCATFVCAMSADASGGETVRLRNYPPGADTPHLYDIAKIWEVARATSAATTFFDPIEIGRHRERFVDGGLGANNPINEMWQEASEFFCPNGGLEDKIGCLVSIGTGVDSLESLKGNPKSLVKTLVAISTETERKHQAFQFQHPMLYRSDRYFRFNAPGLSEVGMAEAEKQNIIAARTRNYLMDFSTRDRIKRCASAMAESDAFS